MRKQFVLPLAAMLIASPVWAAQQSAQFSLSTSSVTFNGSSGNVSEQPVTITAKGSSSLVIQALTFSNSVFSVASSSLPVTVSPGHSYTFEVAANPTNDVNTGTLTVVTNAGTSQVALTESAFYGYRKVSLTWQASSPSTGVAHYAIDRERVGTSFHETADVSSSSLTWTDTQAKPGITYLYRVRAVDSAGASSNPSNVISIPIP